MRSGVFEQIGTASEIYDSPETAYVASFVGNANILAGFSPDGEKSTATIAVRSENVDFELPDMLSNDKGLCKGLAAVVSDKRFAGGMLRLSANLIDGGTEIVASRLGIDSPLAPGDKVIARWPASKAAIVK
jgi:spermidine/putrescine transport system ATP-binding protein